MRLPEAIDTPIRTLVCLFALTLGLGVLCVCATLNAVLFKAPQRVLQRWYWAFGRWFVLLGGTDLRVFGSDDLATDRPYVVVSNHESNWDPPMLVAALPRLIIRFVVKKELVEIPVFGRALKATGNVSVDRAHARGDVARIRSSMAARDPEVSILFFAEGTRSRDGRLRPFKKGAFATAASDGMAILPVAIAGTRWVWTPGRIRIRRGPVVVEVGEPITTDGAGSPDRDALRRETEEAVRKLRLSAYNRLKAEGAAVPPDL